MCEPVRGKGNSQHINDYCTTTDRGCWGGGGGGGGGTLIGHVLDQSQSHTQIASRSL